MSTVLPPQTRVGHVHLKVADLDRAIAFYSGVLGFELQQRFGAQAAFLSAGGLRMVNSRLDIAALLEEAGATGSP